MYEIASGTLHFLEPTYYMYLGSECSPTQSKWRREQYSFSYVFVRTYSLLPLQSPTDVA